MYRIYCLIFLLVPLSLRGQTQLMVQDSQSQSGIPGVVVQSNEGSKGITDAEGKLSLDLPANATLVFSHVSYDRKVLVLDGSNTILVKLDKKFNTLAEVVVSGFDSERPLFQQAASIARIPEEALFRFNEASIVNAFNTQAGVRVEERAPASYRISIRGSSLRSPFGVRNVKVYWNDIPFTSPDGTTPLNILDLSNIQQTEIIKGPAGSIYGAGNGGVISFQSRQTVPENKISTELGIGEFGLVRYRIGMDQQLEKAAFSASYVSQKSDGYRDHSAVDRQVFQMAGHFFPSDRQRISTQLLYSDLDYQIPGALNQSQFDENPRQARPGSEEQNSSIAQKSMIGAISHEYAITPKIDNITSLYLQTTEFENPFILDYKKETAFGYGGRTKFVWNDQWGRMPVRVLLGGEFQYGKTLAQNFGNRNGLADTVRFSDDLVTTQGFLFQQLELEVSPKTLLTVGLSQNYSRFDIDRSIDAGPNEPAFNSRRFDPIVIPRVALAYQLNQQSAVHGSISSGFSPPTIDEVRTNEGSVNLELEAEKGINYELGYRAVFINSRVNLDASAFYFQLDETITTFTNEQGVVLFRNAGATDQKGIEVQLDYLLIQQQGAFINQLKITHAFTGHYFQFSDYERGGEDFTGNQLTGVAPNTLVNQVDLSNRSGIYLNFTHQFVDEIPLNDGNTVYQDAYNLISTRLGWRSTVAAKLDFEVYTGLENLLDETYSLGNDLNAFGGRYFQPAPGRNWFGGIKLAFRY
ncbi:TonB-dependent receptor domain-containing protein [Pararhodonellum marinum]|uniref:TonB-dependent receptor domain-containing protein n=1 Tax=Pararhodonellum marinum TaxID=2755358 RepID=UPI00189089B7|nr:TonB-dependent receptor [Pararhodonellum marinum]